MDQDSCTEQLRDIVSNNFRETDQVRDYLSVKIRCLLTKNNISLRYPEGWSIELLSDCNQAAYVIAHAIQHPRRLVFYL